jgi:Tol biopolymer transport system component
MTKKRLFGIAGVTLALSLCIVSGADRPREQKFQQAVDLFESKGDVKQAIKLFEEASKSSDRNLAARSLLYLGSCYEKLGSEGAQKAYERIVREFGDQADVMAKARTRLAVMGSKQPETGVVALRLWSGEAGSRHYYAVSPDGRFAIFTVELVTAMRSHKGGSLNVHDLLSGEIRKVADIDPVSGFTDARISRDGTQIAYTTETPSARRVHIARADGSNARILFGADAVYCELADWSADGNRILGSVFSSEEGMKAVWFSVADGSYKVIGTGRVERLSYDGRYAVGYGRKGLSVITLDGWHDTPLVAGRNPVWTPDGARVLFQSDRRGTNDLWSIRVVNGTPEGPAEVVRENLGGAPGTLGVTRNGDYYYSSGLAISDLYVAEVDPQTGKLISQPKQITDRYTSTSPAWSPDGESLAYYSKRSAGDWNKGAPLSVVVRSTKTGEERVWQKSELKLNWAKPQWFPDSQSLFIHPGVGKMIQLDVQTGATRFLLNSESLNPYGRGNGYRSGVVLAPNGRSVFYISHETQDKPQPVSELKLEASRIRVIRRDLPDGQEQELCSLDAATGFGPFISPDSSRLAFWINFHDRRSALLTIPANGGAPAEIRTGHSFVTDDQELKPGQLLARPDSAAWSPAGRLFFVTQPPRGGQGDEIWSVPAEGGEAQAIGLRGHKAWSIDVSPDGKRLVFFDDTSKAEMSVLKNLFPAARASR